MHFNTRLCFFWGDVFTFINAFSVQTLVSVLALKNISPPLVTVYCSQLGMAGKAGLEAEQDPGKILWAGDGDIHA